MPFLHAALHLPLIPVDHKQGAETQATAEHMLVQFLTCDRTALQGVQCTHLG